MMEDAMRKYISQRKFQATMYTAKEKMVFDTEMTTTPLSEAESNAYLGDLLYHTQEYTDAVTYLQKALAADPNMSMANTTMGLVKMRVKNFTEAKSYLEKAMAAEQKNYLAFYNYAYTLSREGMDESNYIRAY